MEEHSSRQVGCPQVVEELASRVLLQIVGGLDLDHDAIVDHHVATLLAKLDPNLASHLMPSRQQLALESLEVKVLEETVSKRVVDLEERTDDGVDQLFEKKWGSAHPA